MCTGTQIWSKIGYLYRCFSVQLSRIPTSSSGGRNLVSSRNLRIDVLLDWVKTRSRSDQISWVGTLKTSRHPPPSADSLSNHPHIDSVAKPWLQIERRTVEHAFHGRRPSRPLSSRHRVAYAKDHFWDHFLVSNCCSSWNDDVILPHLFYGNILNCLSNNNKCLSLINFKDYTADFSVVEHCRERIAQSPHIPFRITILLYKPLIRNYWAKSLNKNINKIRIRAWSRRTQSC